MIDALLWRHIIGGGGHFKHPQMYSWGFFTVGVMLQNGSL